VKSIFYEIKKRFINVSALLKLRLCDINSVSDLLKREEIRMKQILK